MPWPVGALPPLGSPAPVPASAHGVRRGPVRLGVAHVQQDRAAGDGGVEAPQRGEPVGAQPGQDDNRDDVGEAEDRRCRGTPTPDSDPHVATM